MSDVVPESRLNRLLDEMVAMELNHKMEVANLNSKIRLMDRGVVRTPFFKRLEDILESMGKRQFCDHCDIDDYEMLSDLIEEYKR